MTSKSIWVARAEELRKILDARGLARTATLADLATDADAATELFLSSLAGYPHNMEEAERQFFYVKMELLTPA